MQLLLAIFYNSYQTKLNVSIDLSTKERNEFCKMLYEKLDIDNNGYLDKAETKTLLENIHAMVNKLSTIEGCMRLS